MLKREADGNSTNTHSLSWPSTKEASNSPQFKRKETATLYHKALEQLQTDIPFSWGRPKTAGSRKPEEEAAGLRNSDSAGHLLRPVKSATTAGRVLVFSGLTNFASPACIIQQPAGQGMKRTFKSERSFL